MDSAVLIKDKIREKLWYIWYCDKKARVLDKILGDSKTMAVRGLPGGKSPQPGKRREETLYFMQKGSKKITAKATVVHVGNYLKLWKRKSLIRSAVIS